MKPIPPAPAYTAIDSAALKAVDWTSKPAVQAALSVLKRGLDANVAGRKAYLLAVEEAALDRVRVMQNGLQAEKDRKNSPAEIASDAQLKTVRDEVGQLMTAAVNDVKLYFAALGDFRGAKLDFAGEYKDYLGKMRIVTQDADKEVAAVAAKLKSMEAVASGLIKDIRERRGLMMDNDKLVDKVKSAATKADKAFNDADLTMKKIEGNLRTIGEKLKTLPGSQTDMAGKAKDTVNEADKFKAAMIALHTLQESIKTMAGGVTESKLKDACKADLKVVEGQFSKMIKYRDEQLKVLSTLRAHKQMPEAVKKALPEKF